MLEVSKKGRREGAQVEIGDYKLFTYYPECHNARGKDGNKTQNKRFEEGQIKNAKNNAE